jgi:hypothetical protein
MTLKGVSDKKLVGSIDVASPLQVKLILFADEPFKISLFKKIKI